MENSTFHQAITQNRVGKDWLIGDIHGHYEELINTLKANNFDFEKDRLFATGDLGDRGLESEKVIQLIEQDWFYSVRGNHDQFIIDQFDSERVLLHGGYSKMTPAEIHLKNEGMWFKSLDKAVQGYLAKLLMRLPYVIELEANGVKIGICHAGVPVQFDDWNEFVKDLSNRNTRELALRTRTPAKDLSNLANHQEGGYLRVLQNIDMSVHGHSCFEKPLYSSYSCFIDTFEKSGEFSLIAVDDLVDRIAKNKDWKDFEIKRYKRDKL